MAEHLQSQGTSLTSVSNTSTTQSNHSEFNLYHQDWIATDMAEEHSTYSPVSHRHANNQEAGNSALNRPSPQRRVTSASYVPILSVTEQTSPLTTFESPMKSIFATGHPTSSVSASTALASLSTGTTSQSSGSFAALTNAGVGRRAVTRSLDITPSETPVAQVSRLSLLNSEKDVDDPNTTTISGIDEDNSLNTSTSLTRLFVGGSALSPGPGPISRGNSHLLGLSDTGGTMNDNSTLTGHLLHRGFVEGRHSDITIYAFGSPYRLHKILLDRVPFFSLAFSGSWSESSASEMTLIPEEIDPNITQLAFELALKRIYGTQYPSIEDQEAVGLFATACWLDMPDLVDSCVESILRQMHSSTLHQYIKLVTNNHYGKAGDRILSSAKAMLYREGWDMPYEHWDNIPAEIIREIIGGDAFFVPSEWERWFLTVKLLNRRLKAAAIDSGLISEGGKYLHLKPRNLNNSALRSTTIHHRSSFKDSRASFETDEPWTALYCSSEISPLLCLLDEGIHYIHLRFEQLQQIRLHKDIFGTPILPAKVISDALWMSMELRQRVLNIRENDLELGLSQEVDSEENTLARAGQMSEIVKDTNEKDDNTHGIDHFPDEKSRKFWIPSNDISCVMGGTKEAYFGNNSINSPDWNNQSPRGTFGSSGANESTWSTDFILDSGRPSYQTLSGLMPPKYTYFPPFRFSAEFPNPRTLKEKKRVYSQTVWYAGSMWNLYIQRVNTPKNQQLGIYLHRAKDKDPSDDPLAQFVPASVDDRIGQLEREMLLRKTERRHRHWLSNGGDNERDEDSRTVIPEYQSNGMMQSNQSNSSHFRLSGSTEEENRGGLSHKTSQTGIDPKRHLKRLTSDQSYILDLEDEEEDLLQASRKYNVPAMPPYLDSRPVIKTYFKIYSPDKAGRMLSIYESAPEKFVVSKSWGWKSSQMVLDDGGSHYDLTKTSKDGKLRYMVVIGNV